MLITEQTGKRQCAGKLRYEVYLMQGDITNKLLLALNKPLLNVSSFKKRSLFYVQILGLIAISVPFVHFYMSVDLTLGELVYHTASLLIASAIVIVIYELTISIYLGTGHWRYSMTVGMFSVNMVVGYLLVIGIIGIARMQFPELQTILDKHSHAGYSLMPLKSTPVLLIMIYIIVQTSKKDLLVQRLKQQTQINQYLTAQRSQSRDNTASTSEDSTGKHIPINIQSEGREKQVDAKQIIHMQADENYVHYWVNSQSDSLIDHYIVRATLKDSMHQLPTKIFTQTHRSHIVNLNFVIEMIRDGRNFSLVMAGGDRVPVSRTRFDYVTQELKQIAGEF